MKCNKCGHEFGNGDTCQQCGADKVAALGEFSGFSPLKTSTERTISTLSSTSFHNSDINPLQICWKCGEVIPSGNYCAVCGQELFRVCPKCQKKYSSQYHICPNCGTNHFEYEKELERKRIHEVEEAREQEETKQKQHITERTKKAEEQRRTEAETRFRRELAQYIEKASSAERLIRQDWVTDDQRTIVLPLLAKLNKEINSVYTKRFDWTISCFDIQIAWENLEKNGTYLDIKNKGEERSRIVKNKSIAEKKMSIMQRIQTLLSTPKKG